MFSEPTSPDAPPIESAWQHLHQTVLNDDALLAKLFATPDAATFRETLLAFATERGLPVSSQELDAAIAGARRAWHMRNVTP
jgi:hypothetical protein